MGEVMGKNLVQAIDRLHMLLPDLARPPAVPQRDRRRLDYWSGRSRPGTGSTDQAVDFLLVQNLLHRCFCHPGSSAIGTRANQWPEFAPPRIVTSPHNQ